MTSTRQIGETRTPEELHRDAVFGELPDETASQMLTAAEAGYIREHKPFDIARVLRDLSKVKFRLKDEHWRGSIINSLTLLENELYIAGATEKSPISRELGATHGMYGRLLLGDALRRDGQPQDYTDLFHRSVLEFKAAKRKLKESSKSLQPDQYEIIFASAYVMSRRYNEYSFGRPVIALARAGMISFMSESKLARHRNESLTPEKRKAARTRARERLKLATRITFARKSYIQKPEVREEVAEMVV